MFSPRHFTESELLRHMRIYVEQRLTRHVQEWRHFKYWYNADNDDAWYINQLITSHQFQRENVTAEFHRCVALKAGDFQDRLKKQHNSCQDYALGQLKSYVKSKRICIRTVLDIWGP